MHASREREGASSPGPGAYYSPMQMKSYLQDLRTNRPVRPTGSRPPPAHFNSWSSRTNNRISDSPAISPLQRTFTDPVPDVDARPSTSHEAASHTRRTSNMSIDGVMAAVGRPLVQPPRGRDTSRSSTDRSRTPSVQYRESQQRQAEQDEARAVRIAMEELELAQEEKLFQAARDEAVELVWKHINPHASEASPNAPYAYPGLARKGSAQRSRSVEPKDQDLQRANSKLRKRHSMGSAASGSRSSSLQSNGVTSGSNSPSKGSFDVKGKPEESTALAKASADLPDFKHRRRSSGARRTISGSLFQNPNDQIYEEPEEEAPIAPAPTPAAAEPPKSEKLPLGVRRNPFMRFQSIKGNPMTRSNTDPVLATKRFDRYEIQKNPPTQSRNAAYTLNPPVLPKPVEDTKADAENEPEPRMKEGKEIRGEDIRAATGFRLRDRSPKLPTPTAVSDAPGRPIVSFKKDWNVVELKEDVYAQSSAVSRPLSQATPGPRPLSKATTAPIVPTIKFPAEAHQQKTVPPPPSIPEISVSTSPSTPSPHVSRYEKPTISIYEDLPRRPLQNANSSRKANTPQPTTTPVPTINVHQASSARSKPSSVPSIPTISVSETSSSSVGGASNRPNPAKAPSISVTPHIPGISISESPAPSRRDNVKVPSIAVTHDIPVISINESPALDRGSKVNAPSIPSINVNGPTGFGPAASTRPLPNPKHHIAKSHSYNGTATPRTHWTPTTVRTGAVCTQCALPIAGRIVSAAGSRFHPECFACYQCGEHLECVAFYPEPSNKHAERVERIRARLSGQDVAFLPTHPTPADMQRLEHDDGTDESPRFFCHLDFHELFSPRCKSCKTPIEGEVIVACGAEWHVGHFFCAQCGDPFDSSTPFVEKEGYAWCINCHTHRFSTKCKGCRKPVTDMVVKALGSEWHGGCFVCVECSGPFDDGRYFLRGESQDPVCVKCEERRLKA
ncbi:Nn.00g017370.m01.CDS01 [Neocucurbitaria sp. VM-36]